jgi:hypothetical protein
MIVCLEVHRVVLQVDSSCLVLECAILRFVGLLAVHHAQCAASGREDAVNSTASFSNGRTIG